MVGESGPMADVASTMVGESDGSLLLEAGISIRVGESEGGTARETEPGEELSPLEGVRTAAPPSSGSEGLFSGRPRENPSINDLDP